MDKKILVMTSVEAEQKAVIRGISDAKDIDVVIAGVGVASAAARTAKALSEKKYDLVISVGIGGGFKDRAEVGSLVIASDIICADLGADSEDGFISVDDLGFGSNHLKVKPDLISPLVSSLQTTNLVVHTGAVLTVSTVTGSHDRANELIRRVPNAFVEAMEGFGVATAATEFNIPFMEIRSISNPVGPRDRGAWRIKEALEVIEVASRFLKEVD